MPKVLFEGYRVSKGEGGKLWIGTVGRDAQSGRFSQSGRTEQPPKPPSKATSAFTPPEPKN